MAKPRATRLIATATSEWFTSVGHLDVVAEETIEHLEELRRNIVTVRQHVEEGLSLREIGAALGLGSPGSLADHLLRRIQTLDAARQAAKVASIRLLRLEGLSLEEVGSMLGVTRQRVASMLRASRVVSAEHSPTPRRRPAP